MTNEVIRLETPILEKTARKLKLGDLVYLNGIIYTFRDAQHIRGHQYLLENKPLPVDLADQAIYHAAPAYRLINEKYDIFAFGPTTSARNNKYEAEAIENFKFRAIIGKGGMNKETLDAMKKHGCVYFTVPSTSALLVSKVKEVVETHWEDLKAEAIFGMKVVDFGPLLVTMDANGNSIHEEVMAYATRRMEQIEKAYSTY